MPKVPRNQRWENEPHFEDLESRVVLAADFAVSVSPLENDFDRRQGVDTIRLTATVSNVGDANFFGRGAVEFYLSADQDFDDSDVRFETIAINRMPRIGQSSSVRLNVPEPALVDPADPSRYVPPSEYFIIARVVAGDGSIDQNPANDAASTFASATLFYEFGNVSGQSNVAFRYTQRDGTLVTLRLEGPGRGSVSQNDGRVVVLVQNTTIQSTLLISVDRAGRTASFGQIFVAGSIKQVSARNAVLSGGLIIQGAASFIRLGGLQNGALTINGFTDAQILDLGDVRNAVVDTGAFVQQLKVSRWIDTDSSPDAVFAPFLSSIDASGDFHPNLTLNFPNSNSQAIDRARIRGAVGGLWNLNAGVGLIDAGSTLPSFRATINGTVETFRTKGNFQGLLAAPLIITLDVGGDMLRARILAGATLGADVDLGGTGSNADNLRNGSVDRVLVRGSVRNSLIAAGLFTSDTTLLNDDDRLIISGAGSAINRIEVRRQIESSVFVAPTMTSSAILAFRERSIVGDPRFITQVPVPEGTILPNFDPIAPPPPPPPDNSPPPSGGSGPTLRLRSAR
jgi:hypothetical protein